MPHTKAFGFGRVEPLDDGRARALAERDQRVRKERRGARFVPDQDRFVEPDAGRDVDEGAVILKRERERRERIVARVDGAAVRVLERLAMTFACEREALDDDAGAPRRGEQRFEIEFRPVRFERDARSRDRVS